MTDLTEWMAPGSSRKQEPSSRDVSSRAERLLELLQHDTFTSLAFPRTRPPIEPEYVLTKLRAGVR